MFCRTHSLTHISSVLQYSLYSKKESAHEDAIWTAVWGTRRKEKEEQSQDHEKEAAEAEEPKQTEKEYEETQIVVTGGVDDLVKIWAYDDGVLNLRHKLADHSLGVVSVALSKESDCKSLNNHTRTRISFHEEH